MSIGALAQTVSEADIITVDVDTSLETSESGEATDEYEFTETPSVELEQYAERLIAPASSVTVMNEAELVAEISLGTNFIVLGTNIYVSEANLIIPTGADITLEGNFILSRASNSAAGSFITVETGASLTINGVRIEAPAGVTSLRGILVSDGADLTLIDGSVSGFDYGIGAGVYVMDGSFEMYGGEIHGNNALSKAGGVAIFGGQFTMYGGEISGNTVSSHGAGVFVANDGVFVMRGGEISGNDTSSGGVGGGVCVNPGSFEMHGGIISGNSAENGSGVFVWSSNFVMYDGEISGNSGLYLTGNPLAGGVSIQEGSFEMRGGIISGNSAHQGGGVFIDHSSFEMHDGVISGNSAHYGSGGGVSIDHSNVEMHGGVISGNNASHGGGVSVTDWSGNANTTFSMWGGEISGNTAGDFGGGIYLAYATFDMWDGKVTNNTAENSYGGGILLDADGILNMHGGEFSGNFAPWGGGIATHGGQFTMYDGTITNNTAVYGGGIYDEFFSWHPFLSAIYGGEVSGNTAEFGGGIFVDHGASFTVSDAEISGNTSELGGGIYVNDTATLNITGLSSIINNSAQSGGGIYTMAVADNSNLITAEYQNIKTRSTVAFSGNSVSVAYVPLANADTDYQNITTTNTVVFSGNSASAAYEPPANADTDYPNIQFASSSIQVAGTYWNPINNFDINYIGTMPVYFVRYFANGGTGAYTDIGAENAVYTVLSNTATGISRTNYNFTGWNSEADGSGTSYEMGDTITITSNVDLYAQWGPAPSLHPTPSPPPSTSSSQPPMISLPPATFSLLPVTPSPPPQPPLHSRQAYLIGTEGYIRPNANITRAEVATIFFRLISDDIRSANWNQSNPYSDVIFENWFNNAVSTTTQLGIFRGRPDGTFAPNQSITRAELASAVVRFMGIAGILDAEDDLFSDIYEHWANTYINAAAMHRWVHGYYGQGGAFYPDRPITRAETVAIINRIFDRLPQSTVDLLPDMITWPDNADSGAWYYLYIQAASNSYTFEMKPGGVYERWIALIPVRNWADMERSDSVPLGF